MLTGLLDGGLELGTTSLLLLEEPLSFLFCLSHLLV